MQEHLPCPQPASNARPERCARPAAVPLCAAWACALAVFSPAEQARSAQAPTMTLAREDSPCSQLLPLLGETGGTVSRPSTLPVAVADLCASVLVEEANCVSVRAAIAAALACEWQGSVLTACPQDQRRAEELFTRQRERFKGLIPIAGRLARLSSQAMAMVQQNPDIVKALLAGQRATLDRLQLSAHDLQLLRETPPGVLMGILPVGPAGAPLVASLTPEMVESTFDLGRRSVAAWALTPTQRQQAQEVLSSSARNAGAATMLELTYLPPSALGRMSVLMPAGQLALRVKGTVGQASIDIPVMFNTTGHLGYQSPPKAWLLDPPPSWPPPPAEDPSLGAAIGADVGLSVETWAAALRVLHNQLGLNVVSDSHFRPSVPKLNVPPIEARNLREALNSLCSNFGYRWTKTGEVYVFQSASWFEERRNQVPPTRLARLRECARANGRLEWPHLAELADLNAQQRQHLNSALWPVFNPMGPVTPVLSLVRSLDEDQTEQARTAGALGASLNARQLQDLKQALVAHSATEPPELKQVKLLLRTYDRMLGVYAKWEGSAAVYLGLFTVIPPQGGAAQ